MCNDSGINKGSNVCHSRKTLNYSGTSYASFVHPSVRINMKVDEDSVLMASTEK